MYLPEDAEHRVESNIRSITNDNNTYNGYSAFVRLPFVVHRVTCRCIYPERFMAQHIPE